MNTENKMNTTVMPEMNEQAKALSASGLATLSSSDFSKRLWNKDGTIWKTEPEHLKIINNSLGWLTVPEFTLSKVDEITEFAKETGKKFKHCVVLGMGGSSLAPEVLRTVFPVKKGHARLHVLDSTDPEWVLRTARELDISKTLFIFASKSGGTVEPSSFFSYFYAEVSKISENPADQFIAITDPGTGLEKMAQGMGFRKIFLNPSDIGGRFSALSLFGMIPAAIMGVDVKQLVERAIAFGKRCETDTDNPAVALGALIGAGAEKGQDKMTLVLPQHLSCLGLWIEQLVAESTGKEGKGIVPIACEHPAAPESYKKDRLFIRFSLNTKPDNGQSAFMSSVSKAGFPSATLVMKDEYDLGAEFLRWEIATAAAGAILRIDPFDQPSVQEAKTLAKGVLDKLSSGTAREESSSGIEVTLSREARKVLGREFSLKNFYTDYAALFREGDYAGIMGYLSGSKKIDSIMTALREKIQETSGAATLMGYGPRYLHSTGQLHKGGHNKGVFIIIKARASEDAQVPGQKYTFGQLEQAQALGDFSALDDKGRRVVLISLPAPAEQSLETMLALP